MSLLQTIDEIGFGLGAALQRIDPQAQHLVPVVDQFVGNPMVKMAPLVLLLLYSWLRQQPRGQGQVLSSPELVVRGTLAIGVTLAAGRILQKLLPMRPRPRFAHPEIVFAPTDYSTKLDDWSSMPSDHAMLLAAILAVIWVGSRRGALLGAAWGILVICLSRVAFGLHYASDILAGLVLGLVLAIAVLRMPLPALAWTWLQRLEAERPAFVILGLFMLCWSIGEGFSSIRSMLSVLRKALLADATFAFVLAAGLLLAAALAGRHVWRRGQAVRLRTGQAE